MRLFSRSEIHLGQEDGAGDKMDAHYERPFYDDPWEGERAEAAAAIWDWHTALRQRALEATSLDEEDFELEAERVRVEMTTRLLSEDIQERARKTVERWSLDPELFAIQVRAAHVFSGPVRFQDHAALYHLGDRWAAPVGRLLVMLAGSDRAWQVPWVDALSRGFFLLGRMLGMPEDVPAGRVFLPQDEMDFFRVTVEDLVAGPPKENVRKLLWKQCVRIRDQFAQALPLAKELPRNQAASFKRWWLGGLEMLNAIERKKYDLWTEPIRLSRYHRAQVRYQARFGRITFKSK